MTRETMRNLLDVLSTMSLPMILVDFVFPIILCPRYSISNFKILMYQKEDKRPENQRRVQDVDMPETLSQ